MAVRDMGTCSCLTPTASLLKPLDHRQGILKVYGKRCAHGARYASRIAAERTDEPTSYALGA
jgi:hypothetical protein